MSSPLPDSSSPPSSNPVLLVRSSWQTVNIGDIAHTPGLLAALGRNLKSVRIILWAGRLDRGVREMFARTFPEVEIVEEGWDETGSPVSPQALAAFERSDFFLHGSGPYLVAEGSVRAWHRLTGKPYGIIGVTLENISPDMAGLLAGAEFVFTRETQSAQRVRDAGVTTPTTFSPDATFASDIRNDEEAIRLRHRVGLEEEGYLCVIPRLRYTPYYRILGKPPTAEDRRRDAVNESFVSSDLGKLRDALIIWVRTTGRRALICPEMTYQVELGRTHVLEILPDDVRAKTVWLDRYWLTDEAASVYASACGVLSLECHSPIIAIAAGTPAIYVRQPTDTIKGQMYRDLGLSDWIFEIDATNGTELAEAMLRSFNETGRQQARAASDRANRELGKAIATLGDSLRQTLSTTR